MANVINLNDHIKNKYDEQLITKIKLCKIRDEIEKELNNYCIMEDNDLAVSLASGRYASMKLTKLIGKKDTIQFSKIALKLLEKIDLRNSTNITSDFCA